MLPPPHSPVGLACALGSLGTHPPHSGLLLLLFTRRTRLLWRETLTSALLVQPFAASGCPLERRRARQQQAELSACAMMEFTGAARVAAPVLARCRRVRANLVFRCARCAPRYLRSCLSWHSCQPQGRRSTRWYSLELICLQAAARCRHGPAARCAAAPPPPRGLASHAHRHSREQLCFPLDCISLVASPARWLRQRRSRALTWCACKTAARGP